MSGLATPNIIVKPDSTKGLQQVNQRFELPYSSTFSARFPAMLEKAARETAKLAAEKNQLRGWHWRSDLGVEVDKSELQIALEDFGTTHPDFVPAVEQLTTLNNKYDRIAFVVKMWFVVPEIQVVTYDNDELAEPDGFVEELPEDGELG